MSIYIMSRKFKKLTLQYSYFELEIEEVDEICLAMDKDMQKYFKENYPDQYEAFYDSPTSIPISEDKPSEGEPNDDGNEQEKESRVKNKDLKKLYRKIAEKTHPDKVGNDEKSDLFSEAATAYSENDLATLLKIASSLNIEILDLSAESIILLEENIENLKNRIDNKKKTTAWAWHNCKSNEEKNRVIKNILEFKGIPVQ